MAAQIDNTDAVQDSLGGRLPKTNVTRDVTSTSVSSLAIGGRFFPASNLQRPTSSPTLADGHAMPSIFAVTPAPSTKVEKLMDTDFYVTFRCNVLLRIHRPVTRHRILIDTHDEENLGLSSTESARSQNFDRYTFDMFGNSEKRRLFGLPAGQAAVAILSGATRTKALSGPSPSRLTSLPAVAGHESRLTNHESSVTIHKELSIA